MGANEELKVVNNEDPLSLVMMMIIAIYVLIQPTIEAKFLEYILPTNTNNTIFTFIEVAFRII